MKSSKEPADADLISESAATPGWQRLQVAKVIYDLFGDIDKASVQALQEKMEWQQHSNGSILFHQGDECDGMYIIINGRLRMSVINPDGQQQIIGEVGPGETIGEFAIMTEEPRSATVFAIRETSLVKISPPVFWQLTREYPVLIGKITRIIVQRQQRLLKGITSPRPVALTLTLIPAGGQIDSYSFGQELAEALGQFGSAVAMNAERFNELVGRPEAALTKTDDPNHPALVAWMSELEADNDFVIFAADSEPGPWTLRCLGQADRVLIIADPGQDPAPGPAEKMLDQLDVPVRSELILWHTKTADFPSGTAAWLDARQVHNHYHVRRGDKEHMARLARRLSGRGIGLVFSGGGARGYAQMGVYRAFLELGIPIDYVGGTSIGAIMSANVARELSYTDVTKMADWSVRYKVTDFTLPFTAINNSEHVTKICQKLCLDIMIEDLWRPFFCISSNLSLAEPVVHTRGLMWRAVRASMAIPGVYTPVMEGDEVLVDGGPMNNFPTDVMAQLCESDYLIGVHVSPNREKKRQYDFDTSLSGWRILFSRLNPFSKPLRSPSLFGTMQRAMEISSVHKNRTQEKLVDLLLEPDVKKFSSTDFSAYADLVEVGYRTALEPLREWQQRRLSN
jgi:predicted acylesterase/phospholipase RssA/CRP-like cAMP-binding protein